MERAANELWTVLQARCDDEEMFVGWTPKGAETVMDDGNVREADQDYIRVTDGGCSKQFLIPLKDCEGDLETVAAPVIKWYEENPL